MLTSKKERADIGRVLPASNDAKNVPMTVERLTAVVGEETVSCAGRFGERR